MFNMFNMRTVGFDPTTTMLKATRSTN